MNIDDSDAINKGRRFGNLRYLALVAAMAGALGSVVLMLRVGRHNSSALLLALFSVWVISPFAALLFTGFLSRRWTVFKQKAIHYTTLLVSFVSLVAYGLIASGPPRPKPAYYFLVIPFGAWLFIATVIGIPVLISRKRGKKSKEDWPANVG